MSYSNIPRGYAMSSLLTSIKGDSTEEYACLAFFHLSPTFRGFSLKNHYCVLNVCLSLPTPAPHTPNLCFEALSPDVLVLGTEAFGK